MNIKRVLTTIFFVAIAVSANAQSQGFAVGANLFSPAGVSAKYTLSESSAITGVVGFSLNDFNNSFTLQANYIMNGDRDQFSLESGLLRSYYGAGLNLSFQEWGDTGVGIRIPLGVEYGIVDQPLEIYMDLAPTINIQPNTSFFFSSSMGVRYFF